VLVQEPLAENLRSEGRRRRRRFMCIIQAAVNWVTFTTLGGSKAEHRARKSPRGPDASGARAFKGTRGQVEMDECHTNSACPYLRVLGARSPLDRPIPGSIHPLLPPFTFVFVLTHFFSFCS
jgi:hypothetical protein